MTNYCNFGEVRVGADFRIPGYDDLWKKLDARRAMNFGRSGLRKLEVAEFDPLTGVTTFRPEDILTEIRVSVTQLDADEAEKRKAQGWPP